MKTKIALLFAAIGISGCALNPPAPVQKIALKANFDAPATLDAMSPGNSKIEGNAFMRQMGGGVVTCAGSAVHLIHLNEYSMERMKHIYGFPPREKETLARQIDAPKMEFFPNSPVFAESVRSGQCDAQGNFEFKNVKPGNYYVATSVTWRVGTLAQGGAIATKVVVQDEETTKVILAR